MRISDWSSDVCSSDLQPVEHVSSLRLIPNLHVWRPADAFETAVAWKAAIERDTGPAALALSRQNLDAQPRSEQHQADAERGGYVLWEPKSEPEAVIIATGSEVQLGVKRSEERRVGKEGVSQ